MMIKICGLTRPEDINALNNSKPDWAGFIIDVPSSKRNLSVDKAAKLTQALDTDIATVGVFVDAPVDDVVVAIEACKFNCVQLHGTEDNGYIDELRYALSEHNMHCDIWQAFKIQSEADVVRAVDSNADLVLLDGGAGEGCQFAWELTRSLERPFILAGGLTPEMMSEAARYNPIAVDISSGVETDGLKDADKIAAAIAAAHTI